MPESRWTALDRQFPEWREFLECKTALEFASEFMERNDTTEWAGWMALNTATHRKAHEAQFRGRRPTRPEVAARFARGAS